MCKYIDPLSDSSSFNNSSLSLKNSTKSDPFKESL